MQTCTYRAILGCSWVTTCCLFCFSMSLFSFFVKLKQWQGTYRKDKKKGSARCCFFIPYVVFSVCSLQEPVWLRNFWGKMELRFSRCEKKLLSYLESLTCIFSVPSILHWLNQPRGPLIGLLTQNWNQVVFVLYNDAIYLNFPIEITLTSIVIVFLCL